MVSTKLPHRQGKRIRVTHMPTPNKPMIEVARFNKNGYLIKNLKGNLYMYSLKAYLVMKKISQLRIASEIGVNSTSFCKFLNGWSKLTPEKELALSKRLKITIQEIQNNNIRPKDGLSYGKEEK
jgi:hypothetical protein